MRSQHLFVVVATAWLATTSAQASVEISKKPTINVTCSSGTCTATAQHAILNVDDLTNMLAAGNVWVQSGSIAKNIEVNAALTWASSQKLTLQSDQAIMFNKPIVVAGVGGLALYPGRIGAFQFMGQAHIEFRNRASSLVISGEFYVLAENAKEIAKLYRDRHPPAHVALAKSSNAAKYGTFSHPLISNLKGVFEGLGNTISNLTISDDTDEYVGFIGTTDTFAGWIRDFGLLNASVSAAGANQYVGTLVGAYSTVFGDYSDIRKCFATGELTVGANSGGGGLVGALGQALISQSYANVKVTAGENSLAGGLVGYSVISYIFYSYASGAVLGGNGATVGGLVGKDESVLDDPIGGISDSYSMGTVTGGDSAIAGGLIGLSTSPDGIYLETSYSISAVSAGPNSTFGGFIGQDNDSDRNFANYWDLDTSGVVDPHHGAGNIPDDHGITGLTDVQLKSGLPYRFSKKVWKEEPNVNNGYPYLLFNALWP